jgi:hypothetical protein
MTFTPLELAFSHQSDLGRHIYIINADGSGLTAVASGDLRDFTPDSSPDAWHSKIELTPPERFRDVWLPNLSDLSVLRLTKSSNSAFSPSWTDIQYRVLFVVCMETIPNVHRGPIDPGQMSVNCSYWYRPVPLIVPAQMPVY